MSLSAFLRRVIGLGPCEPPNESVRAFQTLMQRTKEAIDIGELSPPRVIFKTPNRAKTHIGWFRRRLLRGEFRSRA
jgi:hypothetical protein